MNHELLMEQLKSKHFIIAELVAGMQVHYLDIPVYGNVGDLLIMSGTLQFIENNNISIKGIGAYNNYSLDWINDEDVILLQGGGNFGDIYHEHQSFRENIISKKKNNRIIILPQTIHFSDVSNYNKCVEILSQHKDLHICVRDEKSFKLASKMSKNVYLLPDMAHQLWPIKTNITSSKTKLGFFRVDEEASGHVYSNVGPVTDWAEFVGKRIYMIRFFSRLAKLGHDIFDNRDIVTNIQKIWIKYANKIVGDAADLFSRFNEIHTDRLHGHILACLLNKENFVYDNSYGKNMSYIQAWTNSSHKVNLLIK